MKVRTEKILNDAGVERWNTDAAFQRDVFFNLYTHSVMKGGEPVSLRTTDGTTLAVVTAGPLKEEP